MNLPPEVNVSSQAIAKIVARFSLGTRTATRLAHSGTSHSVYFLDDTFVLRVPHNDPAWFRGVRYEALTVPAVCAVGLQTPALIAVDDTCDLLPVPYTIYERVPGVALSELDVAPETLAELWRCLGRDLARLHAGIPFTRPLSQLPTDANDLDPRPWARELAAAELLPAHTLTYVQIWLAQLAPFALPPRPHVFCHGDVNVGNIMVDPQTYRYLGLIDWAGAIWGDNAYDLAVVSLRAAPFLVQGYRDYQGLVLDSTLEARLLWQHVRLGLYGVRRSGQQDVAKTRERLDRLVQGMQFFFASPSAHWLTELGPSKPH